MNYNVSEDKINELNFLKFNEVIKESDKIEFNGVPGKQHYRMLSYFSTLFNDSIIIAIGTHMGNSALALSYNKTNIIQTFDIVDNVVNTEIKKVGNIIFHIKNLFDPIVSKSFEKTILSSAFIFLDVEPHNGTMEFYFYNYLKSINYKGFVICDDIWYFKEMRDNFWYKIPYSMRYDITRVGHWSGTGIISFNEEITFDKNNNTNWTLVTAYFDLTKLPDATNEINKRDKNYYFESSISTLSLPYNLVIYCDLESYDFINTIRPDYLKEKTEYIICEFDNFVFSTTRPASEKPDLPGSEVELLQNKDKRTFGEFRDKIIKNRIKNPYFFDKRNVASYYLFCMSRYIMLKKTITKNTFNSTHFCWINFCIERMGYKNLIHLDEALSLNRNKFSTCYIDYIPKSLIENTPLYFQKGRCGMCSGFFTGNSTNMYTVCDLIENKFLEYLEKGYGHADEQLYSPVYFENPDLFEHYYGDYQQMITNYSFIYDAPEPPIHNFIANSYKNENYEKCYEACKFVWKSYCLKKCDIPENYLINLYKYYMNSKKLIFQTTN